MPLSSTHFDLVARLVQSDAAIMLEPGKEYLVEARLSGLAKNEGYDSLDNLLGMLEKDQQFNSLRAKVVDAMTTNETSFFRDVRPFDSLRQHVLPRLIEARKNVRALNIWCAASSTGQEPYSLAMLIREHFPQLNDWKVNIVATDLSERVLKQAREGRYSQLEINRGLPATLLIRHFQQEKNGWWQINEDVRCAVDFRKMNLMEPWSFGGRFDLVLIRNVMIYFNAETKRTILHRVHRQLSDDGCLILGSAETVLNLNVPFEPERLGQSTFYRPLAEHGFGGSVTNQVSLEGVRSGEVSF